MMRPLFLLLFALSWLSLTGCGQKGPLYLPDAANGAPESVEQASPALDEEDDDEDPGGGR